MNDVPPPGSSDSAPEVTDNEYLRQLGVEPRFKRALRVGNMIDPFYSVLASIDRHNFS